MRMAVIGVGLIGGSVALAARERLNASVAGYDDAAPALQGVARSEVIGRVPGSRIDAVGCVTT
ncbi:MAG: prephenate dehydrogenase, partial [Solirubrobacteraceae bacterium]